MSQVLTLIRGAPGSGKTTLARMIQKATEHNTPVIVEMDDWRVKDGVYTHTSDPTENARISNLCITRTKELLFAGHSVIVSNTFIKRRYLLPYEQLAKFLRIPMAVYVCTGQHDNVHGVPDNVVAGMRRALEL